MARPLQDAACLLIGAETQGTQSKIYAPPLKFPAYHTITEAGTVDREIPLSVRGYVPVWARV